MTEKVIENCIKNYQKNMINDLHVNVGTLARNLATLCEITTALKKQINNSA